MKNIFTNYRSHFYLISAVFLLIIFYVIQYSIENYNSDNELKNRFQKNLLIQQSILNDKSDDIIEILNGQESLYWPSLERLLNPEDIYTQIFSKDSLIFWNSNHIRNHLTNVIKSFPDTVIREKTGWYLVHFERVEDYRIFLFKLIKSEYPFENTFLPSQTNNDFISSENVRFTSNPDEAQYKIVNQRGNAIVGLSIDKNNNISDSVILLLFLIFLLFYVFIVLWVNRIYDKFEYLLPNKWLAFLFYIIDLSIIRFLDIYFGFPAVLKQSSLFESRFDLITGMDTIGDMLLTLILLVAVFVKFNSLVQREKIFVNDKYGYFHHLISLFVMWSMSFGAFYFIREIVSGLKINTDISFHFSDPINFLALFAIVLINIAILFVVRSANYYSIKQRISLVYKVLLISILTLIAALYFNDKQTIVFVNFGFVILLLGVFIFFKDNPNVRFLKYLVYLIIFAASNAVIINVAIHGVKDYNQGLTANYLSQKNDSKLESVFSEFVFNVKTDSVMNLIINNYKEDPEPAISEYLKRNYFGAILNKYDIQVTICSEDELLEIQPEGILISCNEYFEQLINDFGDTTGINNLYLQNSTPESIYYIGYITGTMLERPDSQLNIYIEFYFTYVPEGLGYPELLVDNNTLNFDLSGYAFAKYSNNKLVYKFGDFAYHTDYSSISEFPINEFYNFNRYRHLKLVTKKGDTLIISRPVAKIQQQLAIFSILFLVLGLTVLLIFIMFFGKDAITFFMLSFRARLQVFFITTIAVTIFIIALITTYYAENNNQERLKAQLNEKTYSVLIELQHKLGGIHSLDEVKIDELYPLLRKFSLVFFSDINVYDPSGKLIATSRPEIFRKGLLSELINPLAFEEIFVDNKLFYTTEEKIGELTYYSSYVPLNLGESEPLGIVNLPYFARQTEVKKSYYLMIFTFLNLFVIAGIIGTFIALLLSKFLTKPLVVLQQSLSKIRIDEQNERIDWDNNDEIGLLIREYNQLVDKIEQSAELLKHSERESAWREVARQIAHEIKNPLTPMKLNVQYLEKAYTEGDPAQKDKIKTISKSLIQQIDTLDKVAEMFSDFAKSNIRKMEEVELLGIIKSSILLYKNYEEVSFNILHEEDNYYTRAIEKDVLRLFNNLIKNAVQSLEGMTDGRIDISMKKSTSFIEVSITDNGKGIDNEFKAKVFQPYFTTKSGGTGLGLAIVKNIMNEIGGSISFESDGNGTTFFLKFNCF